MCQFKSGEAIRINESEVKILTIRLGDSHTEIRKVHSVREDSGMPSDKFHTPVELIPSRLDFNDPSAWKFIFDAAKPDWWTEGMTEQAISQLMFAAKVDYEDWQSDQPVKGNLCLDGLNSIPEGLNPTVGHSLYLNGLTSIPEGFNPTVGISLYLNGLTSIPEGFNPIVKGDLFLNGLTSIPEGFNSTVGSSLLLNGLTSIPGDWNPIVKSSLYLNGLTSLPENFNPTVGHNLYLNGLTSIPEGFNPTVGGRLYLNRLGSEYKKIIMNQKK